MALGLCQCGATMTVKNGIAYCWHCDTPCPNGSSHCQRCRSYQLHAGRR